MTRFAVWGAALFASLSGMAVLLGGWFLLAAGAAPAGACEPSTKVDDAAVPVELRPLFTEAATRYHLGERGPVILAGLTKVESGFGQNMGPSSAGATGWTQFMPATWATYGVDADGDGRRDPMNAADAIHSTAKYLHALGAPGDWRRALFGYNHAGWYVDRVLREAGKLSFTASSASACAASTPPIEANGGRIRGGGRIVEIPWQPGERIDERLLADLELLRKRYGIAVTDGYAASGHAANGEHPLGLAVDIVPGPARTWEDIDRLARWAEPQQDRPRPPFRWVGYNGDPNHGRGNHLHLSWQHAAPNGPGPVAWVDVLAAPEVADDAG
jgi:hypothetical protein